MLVFQECFNLTAAQAAGREIIFFFFRSVLLVKIPSL